MNKVEREKLEKLKESLEATVAWLGNVIGPTQSSPPDTERKKLVYEERYHFESLLNNRISFLLVFSSIILLAAYRSEDIEFLRFWVLVVGTLVCFFMGMAIARTLWLVHCSLTEIKGFCTDPYKKYLEAKPKWIPGNANWFLAVLPILLLLFFLFLTYNEFHRANFRWPWDLQTTTHSTQVPGAPHVTPDELESNVTDDAPGPTSAAD